MKNLIITAIILLIFTRTYAQKTDPWTEYMNPNEIHKMLVEYIGEFEMKISMWMGDGKAPTVVNVKCVNKMILGDRFLELTQTGNMMGMDYQSVTTIGYNTINKLVNLTSITNMGTGTLYLTGSLDTKNRIAILDGKMINPIDRKTILVKQKLTFTDKNNLLIENFDTYEGMESKKSIDYKLTRKP